jgi:hypothetical protein
VEPTVDQEHNGFVRKSSTNMWGICGGLNNAESRRYFFAHFRHCCLHMLVGNRDKIVYLKDIHVSTQRTIPSPTSMGWSFFCLLWAELFGKTNDTAAVGKLFLPKMPDWPLFSLKSSKTNVVE